MVIVLSFVWLPVSTTGKSGCFSPQSQPYLLWQNAHIWSDFSVYANPSCPNKMCIMTKPVDRPKAIGEIS